MKQVKVESIMRKPPVTSSPADSVSFIAEKMRSFNIGAVIIMSGDSPTGIVTERDIVEKVVGRRNPDKTRAEEIMSTPLVTIEADKTREEALEIMKDKGIRRLGVTRNGELVGILTERGVLGYYFPPVI